MYLYVRLYAAVQVPLPEPGRQVNIRRRPFDGRGQGAVQRRRHGASVDRLGQPGRHSAPGAHPAAGLKTEKGWEKKQGRSPTRRTPPVVAKSTAGAKRKARRALTLPRLLPSQLRGRTATTNRKTHIKSKTEMVLPTGGQAAGY